MQDNTPNISPEKMTPMMRQYFDIKKDQQDAILFFRLGDFYEMFYGDAEIAARELDLTLTGRGKDKSRMPMCGIPYHAADNYILRLIKKGYKIAVCEQVEDPALSKGLTKREVVKVITPGTITDEKLLPAAETNYLVGIVKSDLKEDLYGLSYVEASTGEFKLTTIHGLENLRNELFRIEPSELIYDQPELRELYKVSATQVEKPGLEVAKKIIAQQFKVDNLQNYQLAEHQLGTIAAAAVVKYLQQTQRSQLGQINDLQIYQPTHYMHLDAASRRNLELTRTIKDQTATGSLFTLLNKTKTAMGGRLLKEWINYPLLNEQTITERYAAIEEIINDRISREELSEALKQVYDVERLIGRIANGNANARDLYALKESFLIIEKDIFVILENFNAKLLAELLHNNYRQIIDETIKLISAAIIDNPPLQIKEGNIIKNGYSSELDELRSMINDSNRWINELENSEKEKTGIKSLKIGYTSVFGYYIELSKINSHLAPDNYTRKQTLTNAERYITSELKEQETKILNAKEEAEKIEYRIFAELRQRIAENIKAIQQIARKTAELDALLSLSIVAATHNYKRPQIINDTKGCLNIINGRHPVIETTMSRDKFIPNDTFFNEHTQRFLMLFGPNMSGKSTYMRQTALLVLMAQIGSFVPAEKMEFSLVDRLFTRVGAMDDLFSGQSTFMVEMSETANILKNATANSLIIMDEIGRGTSTYDGMSIAWAVAEYVCLNIRAKTLFATHYHELAEMTEQYQPIKNFNVAVEEVGNKITFLHKVVPGKANGSYGVHVASIAGLPEQVVARAQQILNGMENPEIKNTDTEQLSLLS